MKRTPILLPFLLLWLLAGCGGSSAENWVYGETAVLLLNNPNQPPQPNWVFTDAADVAVLPAQPPPLLPTAPASVDLAMVGAGVPDPSDNMILAHYMAWFQTPDVRGRWQHWNWDPDGDGGQDEIDHIPERLLADGRLDLASAHQPLFGPYDSTHAPTLAYHVASAWAAGINGFVVDWYGPNDVEGIDTAVAALFTQVEQFRQQYGLSFYIALTYEEQVLADVPASRREETAVAHLQALLNNYASQESYLTYQDQPVIFLFEAWEDGQAGLLRPEQIERIRAQLPPFYLLYMGAEQAFLPVTDGFYTWVGGTNDDPTDWGAEYSNWLFPEQDFQTAQFDLVLTVGSVWAGFDDSKVWAWRADGSGVPRFVDRQDGLVYAQTWARAIEDEQTRQRDGPAWVQIVTWNDWNEGSEIEPSVEHGRFYLEQTQRFAAQYNDSTFPAAALLIPEQLYQYQLHEAAGQEPFITEIYDLFFNRQFDEALTLMDTAVSNSEGVSP